MDSTVQFLHINMSQRLYSRNLSDYYRKSSSIESMWIYILYLNKSRFVSFGDSELHAGFQIVR